MYQKIIPPYFSNPKLLNNLSGTTEIILGITTDTSIVHVRCLGIIAPVSHFPPIYMYQRCMGLPNGSYYYACPYNCFYGRTNTHNSQINFTNSTSKALYQKISIFE
jgi:hypothetical protein